MQGNSTGWIYVDLGAMHTISEVMLNWEAAFAVDYQIQVSNDLNTWTSVVNVTGNNLAGVLAYSVPSVTGRYVRIYCTRTNATSNYSLYEVKVFGV